MHIGRNPQKFNMMLEGSEVSFERMMVIAEALGIGYEQAFVLTDGETIGIQNIKILRG